MTEPAVPVLMDEQNDVDGDAAHDGVERDVVDDDDAQLLATADTADTPAATSPVVADRADAPVSVITERFLRAIIEQVPLDRIEELHLFSPLKQGGAETGIAVIAARVPVAVTMPPVESAPELPFAPSGEDEVTEVTEVTEVAEVAEDAVACVDEAVVEDDVDEGDEGVGREAVADSDIEHADAIIPDRPVDIPYAPPLRHTVYTARYRLVQKGPERGKWEADVVAEADAPLLTVEMVVRGVQRRAGEESETLRFSASQIARALQIAWPIVAPEPAST